MPGVKRKASVGPSSWTKRFKRTTQVVNRAVRRYVTPELKYLDQYLLNGQHKDYVAQSTTIGEGSDFYQRIGRKIKLKWIDYDVEGVMNSFPAVAATNNETGIFHIILDKQPNQGAPTYAQIFDCTTVANDKAFLNLSLFPDRFKILKSITLGPYLAATSGVSMAGSITGDKMRRRGRVYIPQKYSICSYGSSAAVIPNTNGIIITFANQLDTAVTAMGVTYATRVVFTDV